MQAAGTPLKAFSIEHIEQNLNFLGNKAPARF